MKKCENCSCVNDESASFCKECGTKFEAKFDSGNISRQDVNDQNDFEHSKYSKKIDIAESMKWYKFLINIALWAEAIYYLVIAYRIYSLSYFYSAGVDPEVLFQYYPKLDYVFNIYAASCLGMAVLAVNTRHHLASFHKTGPAMLLKFNVLGLLILLFFLLFCYFFTDYKFNIAAYTLEIILTTIGTICITTFNAVYFNKRKELFLNADGITVDFNNDPKMHYCRKCGHKLKYGYKYCIRCGTPINISKGRKQS